MENKLLLLLLNSSSIPHSQARWSILSNNRDFQQSLQHNTVEQPPLENQRNLIPNYKQNNLDKQQSLQIRIQRKSGVWILRTNRNNGTSHTRLRKLLYPTLDRARWMPDTYIKDNNRNRHSRNKTHTLRNHLQQNPPFHPSTHKRKTTTTNSAAPTTRKLTLILAAWAGNKLPNI